MFRALGFTEEKARESFGFLMDAYKFGAPPHGGMAYGLDRMVMLMLKKGFHPRRHRLPQGAERQRADERRPRRGRRPAA